MARLKSSRSEIAIPVGNFSNSLEEVIDRQGPLIQFIKRRPSKVGRVRPSITVAEITLSGCRAAPSSSTGRLRGRRIDRSDTYSTTSTERQDSRPFDVVMKISCKDGICARQLGFGDVYARERTS